jgi:hypothetical protein
MPDQSQRREAELSRLRAQIDSLDRDWQRLPRMLGLAVLAIPAGFQWGVLAAFLTILGTVILVGVGGYLIRVRKAEYQTEMDTVRRDLRVLEKRS